MEYNLTKHVTVNINEATGQINTIILTFMEPCIAV